MACDHAGYPLKITIKEHLKSRGIDVVDLGTDSEDPVDYPVYGKKLGEFVAAKNADQGIAVCGTGIGISMACNKVNWDFKVVKAVLYDFEDEHDKGASVWICYEQQLDTEPQLEELIPRAIHSLISATDAFNKEMTEE